MAVLAAVMSLVLVMVASFVIDLGLQRVVRRDMQALADVVSFDMSRQLDGRKASVILASSSWQTALTLSVARNGSTLGAAPTVTAEVGMVSSAGVFTSYTGNETPSAVRVTASSTIGFAIPVISKSGSATRSAVATQRKQACIKLGSYAASVQSGQSALLSSLLSQLGVNLTAVGYQGLATSTVSAGALAAALGLGSASELATTTVTYGALLNATATALTQSGQTQAAAYIAGASTTLGNHASQVVNLGGIIGAGIGQGSAVSTSLNVLDLIAGGAFLINGSSLLSVPGLSTGIPGLANLTTALNLIQGAKGDCGYRGQLAVETSQANLTVTGTTPSTPIVDNLLGLVSVTAGTPAGQSVKLTVDLAKARGTLDDVTCPNTSVVTDGSGNSSTVTDNAYSATVGVSSGATSVSLTVPLRVSGKVTLLGIGLVSFTIDVVVTVTNNSATNTSSVMVRIPPSSFDKAYSSGQGDLALGSANTTTSISSVTATNLLGGSVNLSSSTKDSILGDVISTVVNPLITQVNAAALKPLQDLLGVRLGGADVFILGPRLTCDSPALRG